MCLQGSRKCSGPAPGRMPQHCVPAVPAAPASPGWGGMVSNLTNAFRILHALCCGGKDTRRVCSPGTAGSLPQLALALMWDAQAQSARREGETPHCETGRGSASFSYSQRPIYCASSKGKAELQAGPELRGCPIPAGTERSSGRDLPGSVGFSTKCLSGSRRRSWQNCCTSSGQFWGWIITTSPALNLQMQRDLLRQPGAGPASQHRHPHSTRTWGEATAHPNCQCH